MHSILAAYCNAHFTVESGHVGLMQLARNSVLKCCGRCHVSEDKIIQQYHEKDICTVQDFVECYDYFTGQQSRWLHAELVMNLMPSQWIMQVDSGSYDPVPPIELLIENSFSIRKAHEILQQNYSIPFKAIVKLECDLNLDSLTDGWSAILKVRKQLVSVKLQSFYLVYLNK